MRAEDCRPLVDRTAGYLYCPRDPDKEPDEGQTWDECCRECLDSYEHMAEVLADNARDMGPSRRSTR